MYTYREFIKDLDLVIRSGKTPARIDGGIQIQCRFTEIPGAKSISRSTISDSTRIKLAANFEHVYGEREYDHFVQEYMPARAQQYFHSKKPFATEIMRDHLYFYVPQAVIGMADEDLERTKK